MPYVKKDTFDYLLFFGNKAANVCFNLGQCEGKDISPSDAMSLRTAAKDWDTVKQKTLDSIRKRPQKGATK